MNRVFVDTSFWAALFSSRDDRHARATTLWRGLVARGATLVTSDYVYDETMTLIARRATHAQSVRAGRAIRGSARVRLIPVFEGHFEQLLEQYEKYSEGYSFTDVSSFVLMKALRLRTALSFDTDFSSAGFETMK